MLNYLWMAMILTAVVVGGLTGRLEAVSNAFLQSSKVAVMEVALPLAGAMALVLGFVRMAEQTGLIAGLARLLRPVLRRLFPDVPADHPAMGAMVLNLAANALGAGNASTPLGVRAMEELNRLNPNRGTATNAMCLFLVLNTASITLASPTAFTILGRSDFIGPTIFAAACAMITGILTAKFLERLPIFQVRAAIEPGDEVANVENSKPESRIYTPIEPVPLAPWKKGILGLLALVIVASYCRMAGPGVFPGEAAAADAIRVAPLGFFQRFLVPVSHLALPAFFGWVLVHASLAGRKVFDDFVEGARDAFPTALRVLTYLVGMIVAVGVLRESGVLGRLTETVKSALIAVGCDEQTAAMSELLPMALMRPLSGSGSSAVLKDLVATHGANSLLGLTAATMYGSTETTFYVLAVYFGAVGIKRVRHALAAGLIADAAGMTAAIVICRLVFGGR